MTQTAVPTKVLGAKGQASFFFKGQITQSTLGEPSGRVKVMNHSKLRTRVGTVAAVGAATWDVYISCQSA